MKTLILILCTLSAQAYSTVIPVDLGAPRVLNHDIFISNNELSGTPLNGQTVSLDYQFSGLLHLFAMTSSNFHIAIRAETNMTPMPNTLYPSVTQLDGYTVGLNGFHGPSLSLGQNFGIFGPNVTEILFGLIYPMDFTSESAYFTGLHFDMTLPDIEGVQITGLQFHIDPNPLKSWNSHWSITDTAVPDAGATISLLALGLLGIAAFRRPCPR